MFGRDNDKNLGKYFVAIIIASCNYIYYTNIIFYVIIRYFQLCGKQIQQYVTNESAQHIY